MQVGAWGERTAVRFLERHGLVVLKRNWQSGRLEADLVALDGKTIVITEVKTRHWNQRERYPALAAIDAGKRRRLDRLCASFMRNNGPLQRRFRLNATRIDGVEVYYERRAFGFRRATRISWHKGLSLEIPR